MLGHRNWTVVIGSETSADARTRELERFCPESVTGEPGFVPRDGEVDVILSTDILSEGQNLQQAQAVLSFDMPWNPQRVVQLNGRIIRLCSPHDTAYLYTLLPKQGDLDRLVKLSEMGLVDSVSHRLGSLGPRPQLCYFPTEHGIAAAAKGEGNTERFLSMYPASKEWFRLLAERLDAVAVLYHVAALIADADPRTSWCGWTHYRQEPYDMLITLSGGRSVGIVR